MKTPIQRITTILDYYCKKGVNKEKINDIYRKIIVSLQK